MTLADIRDIAYVKRVPMPAIAVLVHDELHTRLAEAEQQAQDANDLLNASRYQDAAGAYQQLRDVLWTLVGGISGRGRFFANEWQPPHNVDEIPKFAAVSSQFLARLPVAPRPAPLARAGVDDGAAAALADRGVHLGADRDNGVRTGRDGVAALLDGRAADAAILLDRAVKESNGTSAGLLLSLGAAHLQAGDTDQANVVLQQAREVFTGAGDALGVAQADQNLAVLAASQGRADEANTLFARADEAANQTVGGLGSAATVASALGRLDPTLLGKVVGGRIPNNGVVLQQRERALADGSGQIGLTQQAIGTFGEVGAGLRLVVRDPAAQTVWYSTALASGLDRAARPAVVSGFLLGTELTVLSWGDEGGPGADQLLATLFARRIQARSIADLGWQVSDVSDVAARLVHLYYYESALGLGDAYAGLGSWAEARMWYLLAVDYPYLSTEVEAPLLWHRIARTYLGEGDDAYRDDDPPTALGVYGEVLAPDLTPPAAGILYTHPALAATGALIPDLIADPANPPAALGAGLCAVVLDIAQRVSQIAAGLDWFGVPTAFVPPFTTEYLQNAARFLAQQAQIAERDYISFTERYDSARLTRLQLRQAASASAAEAQVVQAQLGAAAAEVTIAQRARDLAVQRAADSQAARNAYAATVNEQISLERSIAWYTSQNSWELENPIAGTGPDAGRRIHEVVADKRRRLGEISRDFELLRMDQNTAELQLGRAQADAQVAAAQARQSATAWASWAASLRASQAAQLADVFDSSTFTPEVWWQLAEFMRQHSLRYLDWATRVARLFERAYEFDHDVQVNRIRADYSSGVTAGLLGADQLLADIDYFTYDRITRVDYRPQPTAIRLSLAERFPFAFETEFRRTGRMSFELTLADIERLMPGTFHHRVQAVEVSVVGVVPPQGLYGTLRNGGVSQFRARDGSVRWRVQDVDTQVLSANTRLDTQLFRPHPEMLAVFEGAGAAGTWTLEFPPAVNDIDYGFVVDVEVTLYVEAAYDRALAQAVLTAPLPPEATRASTSLSLRWDAPDAFFLLQSTGAATVAVEPALLPRTQRQPVVRTVALQLLGEGGPAGAGIDLSIGAPAGAPVAVTTNAQGAVPSSTPALAALAGADVLGDWAVTLAGTPEDRSAVYDVLLFVEYDYTPRT